MIRFSLWGVTGLAALVIAILASNATISARRMEQAAELQVASLKRAAEDAEIEARRLAAAIHTLNSDRDRLYTRLTVVEKNLEDVTGAVSKQADSRQAEKQAAGSAQVVAGMESAAQRPPQIAPVASIAATNIKPDPSLSTPASVAGVSTPPATGAPSKGGEADANATAISGAAAAPLPQPRPASVSASSAKSDPAKGSIAMAGSDSLTTASAGAQADKDKDTSKTGTKLEAKSETAPGARAAMPAFEANGFGVPAFGADLGGAKSIAAMRSFWRSMTKKYPALLDKAQPVISLRERKNGLGMELRLIAGPLKNEGLAASLCRELEKAGHAACSAAPYDGQRLDFSSASAPAAAGPAQSETAGHEKPDNDKAGHDKTGHGKPANSGSNPGSDESRSTPAPAKRARTERAARLASEPAHNTAASRSPLEQLLNLGR